MTDEQKKTMSYLEWRSQQTGVPVEDLRKQYAEWGKKGGHAIKGRKLSEEHKAKLREAWRRNNEKA